MIPPLREVIAKLIYESEFSLLYNSKVDYNLLPIEYQNKYNMIADIVIDKVVKEKNAEPVSFEYESSDFDPITGTEYGNIF